MADGISSGLGVLVEPLEQPGSQGDQPLAVFGLVGRVGGFAGVLLEIVELVGPAACGNMDSSRTDIPGFSIAILSRIG
ncbi:MAG: hypothetical protein KA354_11415 [Phycisphaerae bacterium]|nr:hypothetical protein [Phycisphaerae bacterium]